MRWYHVLGGLACIAVGVLAALLIAGASAFRSGFGGDDPLGPGWYVVPVLIGVGGPVVLWGVLPNRRRNGRKGR